jgi:hypothetical protein
MILKHSFSIKTTMPIRPRFTIIIGSSLFLHQTLMAVLEMVKRSLLLELGDVLWEQSLESIRT